MPISTSLKPLYLALFIILAAGLPAFSLPDCPRGKQLLLYYPHEKLDARIAAGFSLKLFNELVAPLADIGYCLRPLAKNDSVMSTPSFQETPVMYVVMTETRFNRAPASEIREPELIVVIAQVKDIHRGALDVNSFRPLLSLAYSAEDMENLRVIFEKKIVENLRTQYICNLTVTSEPSGVKVTSVSGLSDVTPLEWVVPVGSVRIRCVSKGFLPYTKSISLDRPGMYNYFLQMKKRQFYHSKFFLPALGLGVAAGICYYFDSYYYGKYNGLGNYDRIHDPQSFELWFNKAKTCETLSLTCLSLGASMLCLSIWF
jgi:hypothetical protein